MQEAQHEPWSGACRNVMNDARVQLTRACLGGTVLTPQPRCIDMSRLVVDAMVCAAWPSAQYERGSSSFTVRDWRVGRKTQGCQKVSAGRWFWLRSALFLGTRRVRSSNAHSPSRRYLYAHDRVHNESSCTSIFYPFMGATPAHLMTTSLTQYAHKKSRWSPSCTKAVTPCGR